MFKIIIWIFKLFGQMHATFQMKTNASTGPVMYLLIAPTHWEVSIAHVSLDTKATVSTAKVSPKTVLYLNVINTYMQIWWGGGPVALSSSTCFPLVSVQPGNKHEASRPNGAHPCAFYSRPRIGLTCSLICALTERGILVSALTRSQEMHLLLLLHSNSFHLGSFRFIARIKKCHTWKPESSLKHQTHFA